MSLFSSFLLFSIRNDVPLGYFVAFGMWTTCMMFVLAAFFCNANVSK